MKQENATLKRSVSRRKELLVLPLILLLAGMACVRTASTPAEGIGGGESVAAEDNAAATKDAQVQMTLSALLGSATAEAGKASATATAVPPTEAALPTSDSVQLTALAEALTAQVGTATDQFDGDGTATATLEPSGTPAPCYAHRYAYDETYPDGTRVDPGESIQKTWRLQNVGSCDWVGGSYELAFVSGDKMSGQSPLTLNHSVISQDYANFSINLTAPSVPGTYRGHWILRTSGGELIGWGPDSDQSFWVEITVRGATPTP
jgi:hypothetical protein